MILRLTLYLLLLILAYSCKKESYDAITGKYGFNYVTIVKDYPDSGFYVFRGRHHPKKFGSITITELERSNDSLVFEDIHKEKFHYTVYTKKDSVFYVRFFNKKLNNEFHVPYYVTLNSSDTIYQSEILEAEGYKFSDSVINNLKLFPYQLTDEEIRLDSINNESIFIIIKSKVPLTGYGNTKYSFRNYEFDNLEVLENDTLLIREIFGVEPQSITYSKKSSKEMRKLTKGWRRKK